MVACKGSRAGERAELRRVCPPISHPPEKGGFIPSIQRAKNLPKSSYQVIIVSNQKKVALQSNLKGGKSDSKSLSTFKEKATAVMKQLDIPLSIYAATQYDEFRKPRLGMWKEILDEYDVDVDERLDREGSFFVGDAAGRAGDHSCSDR